MDKIKKELNDALALLEEYNAEKNDFQNPLQLIYFGAPGTSKSTTIKREIGNAPQHRITFHPDTDYSNFVGCYKPTKESGSDEITYKFVAQTFVKAYVEAWKNYANKGTSPAKKTGLELKVTDAEKFILKKVHDNCVSLTKETRIEINLFEKNVKEYWDYNVTLNKDDNWKWYSRLVCDWYQDPEAEDLTSDKCWEAFINELNDNNKIEIQKARQTYLISRDGDYIVISTCKLSNPTRSKIFEMYDKGPEGISSHATIARKLKEYSDDFDLAWRKLREEVTKSSVSSNSNNSDTPVFLIIEEINRGNCAQIFGDLFQLLDRDDDGFSDYTIEPDSDLQRYLAEEAFVNCEGLPEEIRTGSIMQLPPNLFIWATMNTSDQSLFPIDSAFKRRWEWKYLPIKDDEKGHVIRVDENHAYDWWEFLLAINERIEKLTEQEDKQLGYWFAKPNKGKEISLDRFVSKVVFYLWNDVFKDSAKDANSPFVIKEGEDKKRLIKFNMFFDNNGNAIPEVVTQFLEGLKLKAQAIPEPALEPAPNKEAEQSELPFEDEDVEEETLSSEKEREIQGLSDAFAFKTAPDDANSQEDSSEPQSEDSSEPEQEMEEEQELGFDDDEDDEEDKKSDGMKDADDGLWALYNSKKKR